MERLSAGYDGRPLFRPITFVLGDGEAMALRGANGIGKTTLLRTLQGLHQAHSGVFAISTRARPVAVASEGELRSARLPQSLFEFVAAPLTVLGVNRRQCAGRVSAALDFCGIAALGGRSLHSLSRGESQRALFARAHAMEARLLFADEPEAGLDPEGLDVAGRLIDSITARGGAALLVLHRSADSFGPLPSIELLPEAEAG